MASEVARGMSQLPPSWVVGGSCRTHWPGVISTSADEAVSRTSATGVNGVALKIRVVIAKDVQPSSWIGANEEELMPSPNVTT